MKSIPILSYHNIGHAPEGCEYRWLYVTPSHFKWQMRTLARLGYRGVSMREGLPFLRGERQGRVVILTFDDGYRDNLEYALPVLRTHGFTATCYLVADCLGAHNRWDAEAIRAYKPLMDQAEVGEWLAAGMEVGSHTRTHPRLTQLPGEREDAEIAQSRQLLQTRLNVAIDHFCYPYGDFDADSVEAVRRAGYLSAVTTIDGRVRPDSNFFALDRITVKGKRRWNRVRFLLNLARRRPPRRDVPEAQQGSPAA